MPDRLLFRGLVAPLDPFTMRELRRNARCSLRADFSRSAESTRAGRDAPDGCQLGIPERAIERGIVSPVGIVADEVCGLGHDFAGRGASRTMALLIPARCSMKQGMR